MALHVMKFGGSSVADVAGIERVAWIIAEAYAEGHDIVAVLSAQGNTTDELITKALAVNQTPSKRELDVLLSTGEQASVALMAMALENIGMPAVSLTGWQMRMRTNSDYGGARIKSVGSERLRAELDRRRIVIAAGYQGVNKFDDITTLGRGGSDTTAVALAAELSADICRIYTDVEGVYTADPNKYDFALKLHEISYEEMLELSSLGVEVLHMRSVEMAQRYGIVLEVLSSFVRKSGTKVKEVTKLEETKITGIASDTKIARISVFGLKDEPGIAFKLFKQLAMAKINVDIILQSVAVGDQNSISFTVAKADAKAAVEALEKSRESTSYERVEVVDNVAKVSVVGAGMMASPGIAAQVFEALYAAKINIDMIATGEIKISMLINEKDTARAIAAIHAKFFGD